MKKAKFNAGNQNEKRKRTTLNKLIASAASRADKWNIALLGGKPRTEIQNLPFFVFGLQNPSPHGEEWRLQTIEVWKKKFADLFFPALMKDDPRPFEELLEAMAHRRKTTFPIDEFVRRMNKERYGRPTKKEMGRRFRLALLSLTPDELLNIKTVKEALEKDEKRFQDFYLNFDFRYYADDSAIYAAMKELNLRFLQPGDRARWTCGGKVVRMLEILPDGTAKESGMTLKELQKLPAHNSETNFRNAATSPVAP